MASILIVDDLISIHEMLEAVIQPTGHKTAFATDGEKALVKYKAEKFDMVLADIDMKPMDGITLLKQLKQFDPTVVVIIMTAYASTESACASVSVLTPARPVNSSGAPYPGVNSIVDAAVGELS